MAPLRYPKVNGKVPESVWSYNKEEKATVKGMIEQIMSDPVMRERRQKALEQFDKAEKIVRKSGG